MSGFLAALVEKLLAWVVGLIAAAVEKWNRMRVAKQEIEKANQQVLDVIEQAQTKEERDRAAEETIRRF